MKSFEPFPYDDRNKFTSDSDPALYTRYMQLSGELGRFTALSQVMIEAIRPGADLAGGASDIHYDGTFRPTRGLMLAYRNPYLNIWDLPYYRAQVGTDERQELYLPNGYQLAFDEITVRLPYDERDYPVKVTTDTNPEGEYLMLEFENMGQVETYLRLDRNPALVLTRAA